MEETLRALKWLEPWEPLDEARAQSLERERRGEVSRGHVLFGLPCVAIAARCDMDDVLFLVDGARLAIVHLTWRSESDPAWPSTTLLSLERFNERMQASHAVY